MLKTRITTAEQNNEMWSSDDKDYTYMSKNQSSEKQDDEAIFNSISEIHESGLR